MVAASGVRPAALSAKAMLRAAVRRSITGFWNTKACRRRDTTSRSA
jgi:hypothetical protein